MIFVNYEDMRTIEEYVAIAKELNARARLNRMSLIANIELDYGWCSFYLYDPKDIDAPKFCGGSMCPLSELDKLIDEVTNYLNNLNHEKGN